MSGIHAWKIRNVVRMTTRPPRGLLTRRNAVKKISRNRTRFSPERRRSRRVLYKQSDRFYGYFLKLFFFFSRRPRDNRNHLVSPPESPRCLCAAAARGLVKGFRGATTRGCQCRNSLRADDGKTKSHNNRPNDSGERKRWGQRGRKKKKYILITLYEIMCDIDYFDTIDWRTVSVCLTYCSS